MASLDGRLPSGGLPGLPCALPPGPIMPGFHPNSPLRQALGGAPGLPCSMPGGMPGSMPGSMPSMPSMPGSMPPGLRPPGLPFGMPAGMPAGMVLPGGMPRPVGMLSPPGGMPPGGAALGGGGMDSEALAQIRFQQVAAEYEQAKHAGIASEIAELAEYHGLDERATRALDEEMKKRRNSFEQDMQALWVGLEGARNPSGLLMMKLKDMRLGQFRGMSALDGKVQEFAKKHRLDAQAGVKLGEVLEKREDGEGDMIKLGKHLERSNKPSSLMMMMLRDLRDGKPVKDVEFAAAIGSKAHEKELSKTMRTKSRSRGRRERSRSRGRGGGGREERGGGREDRREGRERRSRSREKRRSRSRGRDRDRERERERGGR